MDYCTGVATLMLLDVSCSVVHEQKNLAPRHRHFVRNAGLDAGDHSDRARILGRHPHPPKWRKLSARW